MKIASVVGNFGALVLLVCALNMLKVIERAEAVPACYDGSAVTVLFTQYWVPTEGSKDVDQIGNVISLSGPATKDIEQADGTVIESTDANTYSKCLLEGTCLLQNGDLVNVIDVPAETFQGGGWSLVYAGNLTFVTIWGAGHEIPLLQGPQFLQLWRSFLNNSLLPSSPY